MATRCLMAMEYSDWHAGTVLRKHAKKRPLGDLETRYQYTPPQPVLSCRTVDIDVAGTRTYRPLSTTDIISEQQRLIHSLVHKSSQRTFSSAPPTRNSRKGLGDILNSNGRSAQNTKNRAKIVKPATDSFMVVTVDKDLLEMRRFQNELTNQIHSHWRPDNNHLNQGLFVRGQTSQSDVTPSLDAWLTFGGGQGEGSEGVIDAFTNVNAADDYYNVDGSVGSRIAMRLQKGDRIRIGVNGRVVTHDLRVKKWLKEDEEEEKDDACEKQGVEGETGTDEKKETPAEFEAAPAEPDEKMAAAEADFDFGKIVFDSLDKLEQEEYAGTPKDGGGNKKVKQKSLTLEIPLSWDDQVSRPEVKVVSPRLTPRNNDKENLCETHPVFFQKLHTGDLPRPRLASASSGHGYRVKQRALGHTRRDNRFDANSKVKAMTVDRLSPEDERYLSNMSVDDVIQRRLDQSSPAGSAKARSSSDKVPSKNGSAPEKSLPGSSRRSAMLKSKQQSGSGAFPDRASSGKALASHVTGDGATGWSASPSHPQVTCHSSDLNVTATRSRSMSEVRHKPGSGRSQGKGVIIGRTAPLHRPGLGLGGSVSSINVGPLPGDTEYIQIAQPIRNPNSSATDGVPSYYSQYAMYGADVSFSWGASARRNMTSQDLLEGTLDHVNMTYSPRPLLQQAALEQRESPHPPSPEPTELADRKGAGQTQPENPQTPVPDPNQLSTSAMAISIPTADNLSDRESPTPLVTAEGRLLGRGEDEQQLTFAERRELSVRNHHIDHITDLLAGALLDQGQN